MATWIRVRDTTTNHQFDIDPSAMRPGLERLNDPRWPDLDGPGERARPALVHLGKDGRFAPPRTDGDAATDSGEQTPAEAKPAKKTAPAVQPADKTKES